MSTDEPLPTKAIEDNDGRAARAFWEDVGATFPSLKGAASTRYYFDCERRLFETFFPPLADRRVFKTDLWDEAKNTEILRWAGEQGARPVGVDVAPDVVREASRVLAPFRGLCVVSDVRALPFADATMDLIYSMGTIEHFHDWDVAMREIYRVTKPGGTAIIGVPNRLDPFLRPLLVLGLRAFGMYAYGLERSFTMRGLRRCVEAPGFRVTAGTGILFIPGWLRMMDLWCHTRRAHLGAPVAAMVRPFAWLYERVPAVRRHGYLIACVAVKPLASGGDAVGARARPR